MKPSPALLIIVVVSLLAATHVDARESATPLRDLSTYGGIRAAEQLPGATFREEFHLRSPASGTSEASGLHAVVGKGQRAAGDTLCFGNVDGDGFAILGGVWTFDGLQGWEEIDLTAQLDVYGRQITASSWNADPWNDVDAPILSGTGSAWIGVTGTEARDLCWDGGIGYGNGWCQLLSSPIQTHSGGDVAISWKHFNETELAFDYTNVYLELVSSETRIGLRNYTGLIGVAGDHPLSPPPGVVDSDVLTSSDFAGESEFRIVFEVTSDGSWSDEDGLFDSSYGPAGFDDVQIGANSYDFESGLDGWSASACPPIGSFLGVEQLGDYVIEESCQCDLDGGVLKLHEGPPASASHPEGQHTIGVSPAVDVLNDVNSITLPGDAPVQVFVDWDQYSRLPQANGVFYRPGAQYFPDVCELTGESVWSERVGPAGFFFEGSEPVCSAYRVNLSTTESPIPPDAEQIRFAYEIFASCDAFGIPPELCTGITNETPLLDNVRICFTRVTEAPPIAIDNGLRFQDGFAQGTSYNDPGEPGRADVTRNVVGFGNTLPWVLGDSLAVGGPIVSSPDGSWEAEFWFRVPRVGPGAGSRYADWLSSVAAATGVDIEAGDFASASMDSCQLGTNAFKNKFATYLKEEDWAAWGRSGPELSDDVEIIPDDVLFPGTRIEYFLTSNYVATPSTKYFLPDTSGGFFYEFEILPSWEPVGETWRHPSLLYIDGSNQNEQWFIGAAFDSLGLRYDRYDYFDATSNWKAPLTRGQDGLSNNGCTLYQLLGYRGVFINSGSNNITQFMWPEDFALISDWLTSAQDFGGGVPLGLVANGDGIAKALSVNAPTLLAKMGATHVEDAYSDFTGSHDTCVGIEARLDLGSVYETENSSADYEYDAYGNWCPQQFRFDVLGTASTGIGNRMYVDHDDLSETGFAQVVNERLSEGGGGDGNYRTVLDGVSWHHLALHSPGEERCVSSAQNVSGAARNEIAAAVEWIYETDYSEFPSMWMDPYAPPAGIDPYDLGAVPHSVLFQNSPNPFNPRTTIRFSLAQSGPVELAVFDVGGRRVRTLTNGELEAGPHAVVWDGSDDAGHPLASGIYWTQLRAGGRTFSKKATVLR